MTPDFDPWALLKNAWVAIAGIAVWVFKRHLNEDDRRASDVRQDIQALHSKVDANHKQIIDLLMRD